MAIAYVYVYIQEGFVPTGILETIGEGREATASFRYGNLYLQRKDRFAIDPVQLPLHEPDTPRTYQAPEGFSLFNGIRDAAPDGWGRHLMDRAAGSKILSEYDYLVATGDDRVGALAFGSDLSGPKRMTPWPEEKLPGESFDLSMMLQIAEAYDNDDNIPVEYRRFLVRGSSLGGARPKATTILDNQPWIAKFGRTEDRYPVCRTEYATMKLAAAIGLNVPAVRLEKILEKDVYLIKRFDREPHNENFKRLPFISGLTIIGAHEGESSQQSYARLAQQLRLYGSKPKEDAEELWKRMVFNILCNNTDDHLRNHGFLWDGKGWRLSPAYDIVPMLQVALERDLAIGVGKEGRLATLKNAISDSISFGLSADKAKNLATSIQKQVKAEWIKQFKEAGLQEIDIEKLKSCFIACDEAL